MLQATQQERRRGSPHVKEDLDVCWNLHLRRCCLGLVLSVNGKIGVEKVATEVDGSSGIGRSSSNRLPPLPVVLICFPVDGIPEHEARSRRRPACYRDRLAQVTSVVPWGTVPSSSTRLTCHLVASTTSRETSWTM